MTIGLLNLGATCYVNTALQCLFASSRFRNLVTTYEESNQSDQLFQEVRNLFREMGDNTTRVIAPKSLIRQLQVSLGNILSINEQNDLNEFLTLFIDTLNRCISYPIKVPSKSEFASQMQYTMTSKYDKMRFKLEYAWLQSNAREFSPLCPMFYGQSVSQIECGNCSNLYQNYEVFCTLPLPIPKIPKGSLEDCLSIHFQDHQLNSVTDTTATHDPWVCDKCKQSKQSQQTSIIWQTPDILIISLKRFDHQLKKNTTPIKVPEILDMSPWVLSREKNNNYKLKGIGVHLGSYHGGHYIAIINERDNEWLKIDDEAISPVNERDFGMIASNGYTYVYERL